MIREKCSCGAEITVEYRETSWQSTTVDKWRKEHHHEMPKVVAPLAVDAPLTTTPPEEPKKYVTVFPPTAEGALYCDGCGLAMNALYPGRDNFDTAIFRDKIELIHRVCPGRPDPS